VNAADRDIKQRKPVNKNGSRHTLFARISVRFVSFVVAVALLSGGIIAFAAITISKNTIRQEILDKSHTQAELTAQFTANYIEVIQANIRSFATRPLITKYLNENDSQAATEMLVQFVQIQKVLDSSGLYNAEGIQIAVGIPNAATVGQSFADRQWFEQARFTKLPFQSAPIKSRVTGKAIAPYAVPIMNTQNQLSGVLSGGISLEKLSEVFVRISIASESSYLLVDLRNGGLIIAHRDPQMILTSVSESYTDIVDLMSSGQCGKREIINLNGEKELIGFAPMPDLPWGVMIITPGTAAFTAVSALSQTSSIISAIIILVVAVLSGLFILQITRPIRLLVEETREIGKGNLDFPVNTKGQGEIGDLSRAFSEMAGNLKKTMVSNETLIEEINGRKSAEESLKVLNETLEQQVETRTAQLEASNKELESFSYSVSHDLRAPLRHVVGFVELLSNHMQETLDDQGRHYLDIISKATSDMGQLIDDLLSFSRIGKAEMRNGKVNPNSLLKQVIEAYEPEIRARSIEWDIGKLPCVKGDSEMLKLVLSNLVSNALKFTSKKQTARIEVGSKTDPENTNQAVFHVKDNGAGFDMRYKEKLFGVFQRLHSQKEFQGTGIGLANVKRLVQRHGGRVWAEGAIDEGAVFYFTLPMYKEES